MAELLEKIQADTCWALTAKILTTFITLRGPKIIAPLLGKGEGIIAPVMGWKKYEELTAKIWGAGGRMRYPKIKEVFNIHVKDAVGAARLVIVARTLSIGPELKSKIVEATPQRAVIRTTKCAWWERCKECEVAPEFTVCPSGHQAHLEEGLKEINRKLSYKLTKALPWGDLYCEGVIRFKEE